MVATVLNEGYNGGGASVAFELLDWSQDVLPRFLRHPGVNNWKFQFYGKDDAREDEGDFSSLLFLTAITAFWPREWRVRKGQFGQPKIRRRTRICSTMMDVYGGSQYCIVELSSAIQ